MIRTEGATFAELDDWIARLDSAMDRARSAVMREVAEVATGVRTAAAPPPEVPAEPVAEEPGEPVVSLDTLGLIATLWVAEVDGPLIELVGQVFAHGAEALSTNAAGARARRELSETEISEVLDSPLAVEYLASARNRMVRFSDEMWDVARGQLLEGFMQGESIDELRDRLVGVVGLTEPRARTVARTEVVSASNAGSLALVEIAGFTGTKTWLATPDTRTRPTHVLADGQTVGIDAAFDVGGDALGFPGDPTGQPEEIINCRCTLTYDLDDDAPDGALSAAGDTMAETGAWIGVLTVEGRPTGDRRMFAPGALTWEELPLPLLWQPQTDEGHKGSVIVGRIDEVARAGEMVIGRGTFDLDTVEGRDAYGRVKRGYLSGTSVDTDNFTAIDVEYVYGPGISPDGEASVDMVIFHSARLRGATLCAIPAFIEAKISLVPDNPTVPYTDLARGGTLVTPDKKVYAVKDWDVLTAAAIGAHDTPTVDEPWDSDTQVGRLESPLPVDTARAMYAWMDEERVENGEIVKDALKFPHHEVSDDGDPGAANLAACSAGIAALHGARGGTTIPEADRRGVYDHLAAHLRDGGRTPPPFEGDTETMTAAAYVLTIPDVPPAAWFEEPRDVAMDGALTVTDEGRVYGYLAPAGVDHRSFAKSVRVPMGNVDYSLYLGRETIVADGGRVVTGAITMDCGHADHSIRSGGVALDHYDNACSIVATVRIGESAGGVWVAGALVPGVTANQISRMMACTLSGDWRPHRQRAGWREFAGALLVPVPGFAMARTAPSVRVDGEGALVACAVPVLYASGADCGCGGDEAGQVVQTESAIGIEIPAQPDLSAAARMIAEKVGLDFASRAEMIRESIAVKE